VTAYGLKLRFEPVIPSLILNRLSRGDRVTVLEWTSGTWARVRFEASGQEGYVARQFIQPIESVASSADAAPSSLGRFRVAVQGLNLRSEPTLFSTIIDRLSNGDAVEVVQRVGDWAEVRTASGKTGYVVFKHLLQEAVQ
jgi:N-acetylmuramoyl-L-alanine amidase